MAKNLVIVESPAKAKTIENFLGKDFIVKSSYGHVRDLAKKDLGIDVENGFTPNYTVSPDKKKLVAELKKDAKKAEMVWLASDEDREGEAIAWHLSEVLDLKKEKTKRIVFHEITKTAILEAIENPRDININVVDAQQARRVLDRLVGFELSPVLWKKIKPSLSAGRVQSVAVKLIVERENEISAFKPTIYYKVTANFNVKGSVITAELNKRFKTKEETVAFLEKCKSADFSVADVTTTPLTRKPVAPFTTSTLQQEASRKLSFSVAQTMSVAQKLYESGKITYMRTDSTNLSKLAINTAKSEITDRFGAEYSKVRQFATKSKGAQEAHEAIRPTYMNTSEVSGTTQEQRLYELIWKRTTASQMSDAQLEKTTATISVSNSSEKFSISGEVIKFDGFLKLYIESVDDENADEDQASVMPEFKAGESLSREEILAKERFTQQPYRYGEASLVRKMEELGIGRPSTYAPTISTIQKREYVEKSQKLGTKREYEVLTLTDDTIKETVKSENAGSEKGKLVPTDIGQVVNNFLQDHFPNIMNYTFTAEVEEHFDEIAGGKQKWKKTIDNFYSKFHPRILDTLENAEKSVGERVLGKDPKTGKDVVVRIGRFGPMIQIGSKDDEEKPQFAGVPKGQTMDSVNLEIALKLFELPRTLGDYEEKTVVAAIGRFGPYVRHDSKFVSLGKEQDPYEVTLEEAIELIEAKRKTDRERIIQTFEEEDIHVLNGRFGPYISHKKKNYKIAKSSDPATLTLEECKDLIANPIQTSRNKPKAKAKPKATTKKTVKAKGKKK
jgi:DNA topoisomerase-1